MEYEINSDTLAVVPISKEICKIIESESEYLIETEAFSVIEHSCEYFGSTYDGRYQGTKIISGITHKSPIIIEEINKLIFFPTSSPINENCIWVSLNNISRFEPSESKDKSKIIFKNNTVLEVNISYNSLKNQVFRASRLQVLLDERIKSIKKQ